MNERSSLVPESSSQTRFQRRPSSSSSWGGYFAVATSFVFGVVLTLALTQHHDSKTNGTPSLQQQPLMGTPSSNPALHYFAKASTEFVATLPLMADRDNSFLDDLVTSTDTEMPITSGFYRQEKGVPLVYTYTYHEMKIIVAGEFHISDDQGNSVVATAGDVFYFPKGSKITFDSPSFGLGFFCGQRGPGEA